MKRTFNYTQRKKIPLEHARIRLFTDRTGRTGFDAQLSLDQLQLPQDALVYIEAYRQNSLMRFPWGTVGHPAPPADRLLLDFDSADDVLFRIKVVNVVDGSESGLLSAEADQIAPAMPGEEHVGRLPLLPVKAEDLAHEAWQLEFDPPKIRLLVNANLGDVQAVARSASFRTLVYPCVLRSILAAALCDRDSNGELPSEPESTEWQATWTAFCRQLPGIGNADDPFELDDLDDRKHWIEQAVSAFCRQLQLGDLFSTITNGEPGS